MRTGPVVLEDTDRTEHLIPVYVFNPLGIAARHLQVADVFAPGFVGIDAGVPRIADAPRPDLGEGVVADHAVVLAFPDPAPVVLVRGRIGTAPQREAA